MISNLISSSVVIFDVIDKYNISSEDFVTRAPNWIKACIKDLGYIATLTSESYETKYNHGRALLPPFCESVEMVVINGTKIDYNETLYLREDAVDLNRGVGLTLNLGDGVLNSMDIEVDESDLANVVHPFYKIENGWLHTNVVSGYLEIVFKKYPTEFNEILGLECPLIPDEYNTREAIGYYILKTLLMRGYTHPLLSLKDNNPLLNPGIAYERHKVQSRIKLNAPTKDKRSKYTNPLSSIFGKRKPLYQPTARENAITLGNMGGGEDMIPAGLLRRVSCSIGLAFNNPTQLRYSENTPIAATVGGIAGYNYLFISIPSDRSFTTSMSQEFEFVNKDLEIGTVDNNIYRTRTKFYTENTLSFTIEIYQ